MKEKIENLYNLIDEIHPFVEYDKYAALHDALSELVIDIEKETGCKYES